MPFALLPAPAAALLVLLLASTSAAALDCAPEDRVPGLDGFYSTGWGIDARNTRYQPRSALRGDNAHRLALSWSYGLASDTPRSYPLVTEDTVFIGDGGRGLVALDRRTGCERWLHAHAGPISSAIIPGRAAGRDLLLFNDRLSGLYAVDARDGALVWHAEVLEEPVPWYSGTPLVVGERVFLPIASLEVGLAANPFYGCCTTSGGMAAFDLATGKQLWYRPTIETAAEVTGSHWGFVQKHGPSGAAVWGAPSHDADGDRLYFGTGQNFSHPTTDTSDAIFSLDPDTGAIVWVRQFTANDAYTAACNIKDLNHPNCPEPSGPDVDFGAPTLLTRTPTGQKLLIGGQKSAEVHAMDPATGSVVWSQRLGRGGIIGGVHWGMAVNEAQGLLFVPISDKEVRGFPAPGTPEPGLYALRLEDGSVAWRYQRESRCPEDACVFGLSAGITAANDVVVAGGIDGYLNVFDAATGRVLWTDDTWRDFEAVNDIPTRGGAFDAHGPMLADDQLIVVSGYGYVGRQRGGNALLVYALEAGDE